MQASKKAHEDAVLLRFGTYSRDGIAAFHLGDERSWNHFLNFFVPPAFSNVYHHELKRIWENVQMDAFRGFNPEASDDHSFADISSNWGKESLRVIRRAWLLWRVRWKLLFFFISNLVFGILQLDIFAWVILYVRSILFCYYHERIRKSNWNKVWRRSCRFASRKW